ncbi:FGGY-family pentulose kinase [Capsaspora owczarzaki ATCC 30864]|uniref:FGGY-family pentulose kinase n=2 Tax=Capsaspora owczarzaki (strain ATCC 30864) TaxID=595528 RepID=A0A0D2UF49_CAPO3|nr:FGGY-family pentulose kinase [Capsaspora owczarzaki ATCC 30864]
MDHRASKEAAEINQTNHNVLNYVGGKVSLEMQMPKLLWLKRNMQEACWTRAAHFYDLPDFLTFRATGSSVRSLCSLVCKWTYMHHPAHVAANAATVGWSNSFLQQVGLDDLATDNYARLGTQVQAPGSPIANGLSAAAAAELGLLPGTPVATSLIDAHAGGVGALGARSDASTSVNLPERLALICGTSSCHMALSAEPLFVPGVWGPYYSAMVPELYLNEGGQSATGKLIDHIIKRHAAYPELASQALARQRAPTALLTETLTVMAARAGVPIATLSRNVHVLPYFHGNRSPLADPSLRGSIVGLSLSETIEDLAVLYLATVQAIAYGTRHILETMASRGHSITTLVACGGLAKSSLFVQQHADVSGCTILLPKEEESVLLGAAILGACGSRHFPSIQDAMASMSGTASTVTPDATLRSFHEAKFKVFRRMHEDFLFYRTTMEKTE